jgi:hypothetical protein
MLSYIRQLTSLLHSSSSTGSEAKPQIQRLAVQKEL